MFYTYFRPTPSNLDDAKRMYRDLAMRYHPDRGGDTRTMQDINAEWADLQTHFSRIDQDAYTRKAHAEGRKCAADFNDMDKIFAALREKIKAALEIPNVTVELCGLWIWVTGDTKPARETLKTMGFHFAPQKVAWYFAGIPSNGRGRKSLDEIRNIYGSTTYTKKDEEE